MANEQTFRPGMMASQSVTSYLTSVKMKDNDEYVSINDGALLVVGGLAENTAFSVVGSEVFDYNTHEATFPAATTDKVVIVDLSEVSNGTIAGNDYKLGKKLFGLKSTAGMAVRARRLVEGDKYWINGDCIDGDVTVGNFLTPTVGSGQHTAVAADPGNGFVALVVADAGMTVGTSANGTMYLCQVVSVA